MKDWGKDFQVPMKSEQMQMVSPRKGDANSSDKSLHGEQESVMWLARGVGGPAHSCLVGTRVQLPERLSVSREPGT